MELSSVQTNLTKGLAILMMLCLHLFNKPFEGLFEPLIFIGSKPLAYYLSLFSDCCVAIYCFCSGYGLYIGYAKKDSDYNRKNYIRLLKLYLNYWIVLLLFVVFLGLLLGRTAEYPGNFIKFMYNFTAIDTSYNGTWWFVFSYILLVLASSTIFKIIDKYNYIIVLLVSFVLYALFYVQLIKTPIVFNELFLDLILRQITSFGFVIFPFVMGAVAYQQKWYSVFSAYFQRNKNSNFILMLIIIAAVIFHGFVPTLFIAVFTGFLFIFCFNALRLPNTVQNILKYFSKHSTNIWLTHMLFYSVFFKEIIYAPKYPILIYLWLLLWCLVASYIVNLLYDPILKWVNLKTANAKIS